ncbi:unnamed protein product [Arabis nemorensis]|uniref:Dof zinc finger protein n=1 Tax=Arabis nemorensis TaxID=586526 RepID=A0A565CF78_9BRAS|nr:unnamed protein product [Arabis nemorensis]
METPNVDAKEGNQVNGEKPPPRVCPRCTSENTKFCYYNNYSMSQPRYFCKNCRRYWTHGGALRNIPIGGSCRKAKRPRIEAPPSVSQVVSVEINQVTHQPFIHVQETNEFLGSFGGSTSSSAVVVGNHYGSLPEIHADMVTNATPIRSFRPMETLDFSEGSTRQDYYDVGSNDLIGNPLINQSFGGSVDIHNRWNKSFTNTMNMNHIASTSGGRGSSSIEMNRNNNRIINNCVIRSYHLEKHGP